MANLKQPSGSVHLPSLSRSPETLGAHGGRCHRPGSLASVRAPIRSGVQATAPITSRLCPSARPAPAAPLAPAIQHPVALASSGGNGPGILSRFPLGDRHPYDRRKLLGNGRNPLADATVGQRDFAIIYHALDSAEPQQSGQPIPDRIDVVRAKHRRLAAAAPAIHLLSASAAPSSDAPGTETRGGRLLTSERAEKHECTLHEVKRTGLAANERGRRHTMRRRCC